MYPAVAGSCITVRVCVRKPSTATCHPAWHGNHAGVALFVRVTALDTERPKTSPCFITTRFPRLDRARVTSTTLCISFHPMAQWVVRALEGWFVALVLFAHAEVAKSIIYIFSMVRKLLKVHCGNAFALINSCVRALHLQCCIRDATPACRS